MSLVFFFSKFLLYKLVSSCSGLYFLLERRGRILNSRLRCRLLGKHSLKKDDYLTTMMLVPPKQRMRISHFDAKTQEDAFTVSLEGLKGVRLLFSFLPPSLFIRVFLDHVHYPFSSCDIIFLYSGMSMPSCWNLHKPGKTGKSGCVISFVY